MARYSIESTTLTALGDAVRSKVGETRKEYVPFEGENTLIFSIDTKEIDISQCTLDISGNYYNYKKTITLPEASSLKLVYKTGYHNGVDTCGIYDGSGNFLILINSATATKERILNNEDTIELKFEFKKSLYESGSHCVYHFEVYALDSNGDLLTEVLADVKNTMTPTEMAEKINNELGYLPEEVFTITGDCEYRFAYSGWNWFINNFGNRIKTENITNGQSMFDYNRGFERIPFDINMTTNKSEIPNISYMFRECNNLKEVPKITGLVRNTKSLFEECENLLELKEESVAGIDWSLVDGLTSSSGGERDSTFADCDSLRKFPMSFLAHGNPQASYSTCIYRNLFSYCYVLDEVVGLPNPHYKAAWTSNAFNSTFYYNYRLKRFTFETNPDGTPYTVNWKKQTITLDYVGFCPQPMQITNHTAIHGIGNDKLVYDDATYQALKDDADWWTKVADYSRYNKASAIETINSLPICPDGAGNAIKFKGAAGALTDGGAINTMTEEEIAVATAKGWTVSFT